MAYFHHGTLRRYTSALLDLFNDIEVQYKDSAGLLHNKKIPIVYSAREKSKIFDQHTAEQLLSGNLNILPRAFISLASMTKLDQRVTNKNNKIGKYKDTDTMEFMFNSVPYEFTYELVLRCRGMNEVSQIIEQIAPKFNPTVNIDVYDAQNLDEPTRLPLRLLDISVESEELEELSTNLFIITASISLMGNLYQPIKSQPRIKEFIMKLDEIDGDYYTEKTIMGWDIP